LESLDLSFFEELGRRNVFRVAVGCVLSCWLLFQVADAVLENIAAPDWVIPIVMLLLALGFPVVLPLYKTEVLNLQRNKNIFPQRTKITQ
jgi:hypothetical protein